MWWVIERFFNSKQFFWTGWHTRKEDPNTYSPKISEACVFARAGDADRVIFHLLQGDGRAVPVQPQSFEEHQAEVAEATAPEILVQEKG